MSHAAKIRQRSSACAIVMAALVQAGCPGLWCAQSPDPPPAGAVVLDRVVAVVNNQAILSSEVDEEVRLSILDPTVSARGTLTAAHALDLLISRALIQQQMRQDQSEAAAPTQAEVIARMAEMRRELPACVHENCATVEGWTLFLAAHGLTEDRVERYVRNRIEVLRFIEQRFRPGIRVSPQEVEAYYRNTLLPQYAPGAQVPQLEQVAPRIEEILLQQQVNALFDNWLRNLRREGEIEVLDPALESPEAQAAEGKENP